MAPGRTATIAGGTIIVMDAANGVLSLILGILVLNGTLQLWTLLIIIALMAIIVPSTAWHSTPPTP